MIIYEREFLRDLQLVSFSVCVKEGRIERGVSE